MEVTIKDQKYRIGRLSALKQLHLTRRLAPVLLGLSKAAVEVDGKEPAPVAEGTVPQVKAAASFDLIITAISPLMDAISKMEDKEVDYIINTCLSVVEREDNGRWARVQNPNGQMMYQDIDLPTLIQLSQHTIRENLQNFFPGPQVA